MPPDVGAGPLVVPELAAPAEDDEDELPHAAKMVPSSVVDMPIMLPAAQELTAVQASRQQLVDVVVLELRAVSADLVQPLNLMLIHELSSFRWRSIRRRPLRRNRR